MPQRLLDPGFSTLFEFLPIGAYRCTPQGVPLRANPALQRLNGFDSEAQQLAAAGDDLGGWYVDPSRRSDFMALLARDGRVVGFESEAWRHVSRERIWIRENAHMVRDREGRPLYYEGTIEEITAQVRDREALRVNQQELRQIMELVPGMVYRVLVIPGGLRTATFISGGCRAIFGVEPEALLADGLLMHRLRHPDDRERIARETEAANAQRTTLNTEYRVLLPSGELKWVQVLSAPAPAIDGVEVRVGVVVDITASKQAETLRGERDRAAAADLAKSAFLSRVSHELRTPLNAVLGFAQLLETDPGHGPHSERQLGWTRQVLRSGRHLVALMDDILDLSSLQSGGLRYVRERVPMAALVEEAASMLTGTALAAGVQLQCRPLVGPGPGEPEEPAVLGDRKRVLQVLCNLLSNAIKYNRRGGWVRVRLQADSMGLIASGGPAVALIVADSGPGLDAGQIARLFQPFERLGAHQGSVPGTGLGLALSRQLVEAMGGAIGVESAPGQGSVFRVSLPAAG